MEKNYNTRSPAVKRLMREAAELSQANPDYHAQPLQDNLFEWHFTVRGPSDTDFQGGVYHGRIIVPAEYPMKPPDIIVLTPNGRFEIGKKICLSISGFHPESWQPSWSIRTALLAIIGFMPTPGHGTIGSLDYPPDERRRLAHRSIDWSCPECGRIHDLLPPPDDTTATTATQQQEEMRDIVKSMALKTEEEIAEEKNKTSGGESVPEVEKADEKTDATPTSTTSTSQSPATSSVASSRMVTTAASASVTSSTTTATTTTTTTTTTRSAGRVDIAQNRSSHVYDLMILVLVAAIAALLYRRISLVQDDGSMGGPTEEL